MTGGFQTAAAVLLKGQQKSDDINSIKNVNGTADRDSDDDGYPVRNATEHYYSGRDYTNIHEIFPQLLP